MSNEMKHWWEQLFCLIFASVAFGLALTFAAFLLNDAYRYYRNEEVSAKQTSQITVSTEQPSTEPIYLPRTVKGTTDNYGYIVHLDDGTYLTIDDAPEFPDGTRVVINWDTDGNIIGIDELKNY